MWKRRKKGNPLDGASEALRDAKSALKEVQDERDEVNRVSSFHRIHRVENHWSQRIGLFLKGHQT